MVPFKETIKTKKELIEECKRGFEDYSNHKISKNDFCMYFGFTHGKAITTFYKNYEQLLIDGGFNSGSSAYFSGGINAWKNLRDGKYVFPPFVQDESKSHYDNRLSLPASPYRPYITAIKSKPFLLLAGISGTGKSRIVRELARACWDGDDAEFQSQKPRNFEMIQVKPNWHDSSELIGYVSRVSGTPMFVAGDFLKFIARAWEEPDVPYFLCLDEMNLAPVEQYFAEYLSVIESRKADTDGNITTDPILKKSAEDWFRNLTNELTVSDGVRSRFLNEGISIPQNLIVIGTVNMDETTFSFSRKVLDRAMTIEMNEVDLHGGLSYKNEQIGKIGKDELVSTAVEGVDIYESNKEVCDKALDYLQKVNDRLEGTPFKIAYRTRNEVLLYVVNNLPYKKENETQDFVVARALDEITNMKILSRIEGDETKVSTEFFNALESAVKSGLEEVCGSLFAGDVTYNAISLAKLGEMKKRLASGYTSFWS
ncbi:MAG: AAA family ATPase [Bacteroidaceae bacterium]|nr:AAA family ATPase [Bacteroidaceae bacterium]